MKASVGRIVHYVAFETPGVEGGEGGCRAAIVTAVCPAPGFADLCVLNPTGQFFKLEIRQDEAGTGSTGGAKVPGTWHWPERVEE